MPNIWSGTRGDGGSSSGGGFPSPVAEDLNMGAFNITSAGGNSTWTVLPTGVAATDTANIQAALDAAVAANGGTVQLEKGDFTVSAPITYTGTNANGVKIKGRGIQTRIHHKGTYDGYIFDFTVTNASLGGNNNINNVTKGDTTITMTTAGQAAPALVGDLISFYGTDADGFVDVESHYVSVAGNAGTGVVGLATPVLRTMTSVLVFPTVQVRNNDDWYIGDFAMILDATPSTQANGIIAAHFQNLTINNVHATEGWNLAPTGSVLDAPIVLWDSIYSTISNCVIRNAINNGIFLAAPISSRIINCIITHCATQSLTTMASIVLFGCSDILVSNNYHEGSNSSTFLLISGSNPCRRNLVTNNIVNGAKYRGVDLTGTGCKDTLIANNVIKNIVNEYGVYNKQPRNTIDNNIFIDCNYSVYCEAALDSIVTNNKISGRGSYGVALVSDSTRSLVANNSIIGSGGGDAGIYNASDNCLISNNHVSGTSGKGVNMPAGADNNLVTGNHFVGTGGITDGGSNNDVTNNKLT